METRIEQVVERHKKGYSCSQAVGCSYCDLVGMDEETMFKVTEGFGIGMGNFSGTCGALTAVATLAGLLNSNGDLEARNSKAATFKLVRGIMEEFKQMNGSVICHELKGMETGQMLRSCRDCVIDAANLAEKHLFADK